MDQIFNIKRFSLLFAKHTTEHYKAYLMAFFVLVGGLLVAMGFLAYLDNGSLGLNIQNILFVFVLQMAGSIFTSIVFSDLGDKKKAISMLTLPASHFEKFLVRYLYTLAIFPLFYTIFFYLVVILINQISSLRADQVEPQLINIFDLTILGSFAIYAFCQSIALWGSIYFLRNHFIKTASVILIGFIGISLINLKILKLLVSKDIISALPFSGAAIFKNGNSWRLELPADDSATSLILIAVVLILWLGSYFRLKEKEV